jgi:hypothetical protein
MPISSETENGLHLHKSVMPENAVHGCDHRPPGSRRQISWAQAEAFSQGCSGISGHLNDLEQFRQAPSWGFFR